MTRAALTEIKQTRPILRWHGGKWRIAPEIIRLMGPHNAYVEPFGGAASVLIRKPRSRLEVYNDLDCDVVNLFQVLRDNPDDLARLVSMTPFARSEFEGAYFAATSPLERARRFLILSHMGFGSNATHRRSGFRAAGMRAGVLPVHNWDDLPKTVLAVADRFRGVVIENRPACNVIAAHDGPDTLHYVDPPYHPDTRGPGLDYAHEMTVADHTAMLVELKQLQGAVILSGYAHPSYDAALDGWHRIERRARADQGLARTEVIWTNRRPMIDLLGAAI